MPLVDSVTVSASMLEHSVLRLPVRKQRVLRLDSLHLAPDLAGMGVGLLILSTLFQLACGVRSFDASARPDLILITVDTLRADHLELYGHTRTTTPNITKLARSGIVFKHAVASAPWTLPSMASVHTGLSPSQHGAVNNATPISQRDPTVASLLEQSGYETQAVVSHVFVGSSFGFARGFDRFDERHLQGHDGSSSQALTAAALESFAATGDAPTFLWVHYFDPHYSYERHPEYDFATGRSGRFDSAIVFESPEGTELLDMSGSELRYMRDVYDEEIAHTDHHIGALIDGVLASGRDRPAIFFVTGDHGEAFLDHGRLGHGRDLYDELIHVPLIVGGDIDRTMWGLSVGSPVETASIATTLLGLAGVNDHGMTGTDLFDAALSRKISAYVFSEGSYARGHDGRKVSIERGRWKLIRHLDDGRLEFYDRGRDADETRNLVDDAKNARIRDELIAALDARISANNQPPPKTAGAILSDDERKKLETLGYLDSGTERSAGE